MKRLHIYFLLLFISLTGIKSFGQAKGRLLDYSGEPLSGVLIYNKMQYAVTKSNGWFMLNMKVGDTLIIKKKYYVVSKLPFIVTITRNKKNVEELEEVLVNGRYLQDLETVHFNKEDISRYRGNSNGDLFNGVPGLQVNNIRNEAGGLDIGIRGIQGEGRVPIIIDGGLQSTQTFRGYQGSSDRTYIDIDLIREVKIDKGASFGSALTGATGGVVKMTTLGTDDVVLPGKKIGAYIKGSVFNNNKNPVIGNTEEEQQYYVLQNSIKETNITNANATLALAYKGKKLDAVAAYSLRNEGNYFAGKNGAERYGYNPTYYDSLVKEHKDLYKTPEVRPGQEVVNTSYQSRSFLVKLGWNPAAYHRVELNYRYHDQRAAEVLASYWYKNSNNSNFKPYPKGIESMPQWSLGTAFFNFYTLNYRYNPNNKINIELAAFTNSGTLKQRNGLAQNPGTTYGDQYLHKFKNGRSGASVQNTTRFNKLPLLLKYGLSVQKEKLLPFDVPENLTGAARNGMRQSYIGFLSGNFQWESLLAQADIKLHGAKVNDYNVNTVINYGANIDLVGKISYAVTNWLNAYLKTSRLSRSPSLYESTTSTQTFSYNIDFPLKVEVANAQELGFQSRLSNAFITADKLTFGAALFQNNSSHFISPSLLKTKNANGTDTSFFSFINYDQYRLTGIDIMLYYETPFAFLDASAVLYKDAMVCSKLLGNLHNIESCNTQGFEWSVLPSRIPPKQSFSISSGVYFFNKKLVAGGRFRYHNRKENPKNWLQGTGAAGVAVAIPADHTIDAFLSYKINTHFNIDMNVNNVTNRYQYDVGSVLRMPAPGRNIHLSIKANF